LSTIGRTFVLAANNANVFEVSTTLKNMKRRNFINGEEGKKSIQAHLGFVGILTLGAFFRIASEGDIDGNTTMFGMILAIGVIIALSFFNQFVLDLCNDLNTKWPIINSLIPGTVLGIVILVFRIPVEPFDVMLVIILFAVANLVMYLTLKASEGTRRG
jgi:hypothetical protein